MNPTWRRGVLQFNVSVCSITSSLIALSAIEVLSPQPGHLNEGTLGAELGQAESQGPRHLAFPLQHGGRAVLVSICGRRPPGQSQEEMADAL